MKRAKELYFKVLPYSVGWFFVYALVRSFIWFVEPDSFFGGSVGLSSLFKGYFLDLISVVVLSFTGFTLAFLFSFIHRKLGLGFFHLIGLASLFSNFALLQYYLQTREMLNESIYLLSWNEIKMAAGTGERLSGGVVLVIVLMISGYFGISFLLKRYLMNKITNRWSVGIGVASLLLFPFAVSEDRSDYADYVVSNNKLSVFLKSSFQYFVNGNETINKEFYKQNDYVGLQKEFLPEKGADPEYPLLHALPSKSQFGSYFNKSKTGSPNIVFIIVESLSSCMVGDKADKTGHLMPFLDSLSAKSLFFPNFLSTCERTHNVLPASLASVPNAPRRSMMMTMEHPEHWSLISLLQSDYYSRYYCGVDLTYCNMKGYMNYHNTNYLVKDWEKQFTNKIDGKTSQWGYPDAELFAKSIADYKRIDLSGKKRMDVFLTISTHDPFIYPNRNRYTEKVKKKLLAISKRSPEQNDVLKHAAEFGSYMYTDDAFRKYFKKISKQKDFENTIFFIFGDHGNQFCLYDALERYKTPLIVYSPLLKKPQKFNAVSTHLDLAPTILNYLKKEYGMNLPDRVPFIGQELDFSVKYRCNRSLPMNSISLENNAILDRSDFMYNGQLYKVGLNLKTVSTKEPSKLKKLKEQIKLYDNFSAYIYYNNRFVPESYFSKYVKKERFNLISNWESEGEPNKPNKNEFVDIGENLKINSKTKAIKLQFTGEFFLKELKELESIPLFSVSLENIKSSGNELLVWKQANPSLLQTFKSNQWNKVIFQCLLRLKDYNSLKTSNQLKYYLLNSKKLPVKIRNMKSQIYISQ